jgi:hypothetical protein
MNTRQKKVLESWRLLLREFVKREWLSIFLSTSLGVLAAEAFDLLLRDWSFQYYLMTHFEPSVSFDDPKHYFPYLAIIFGTMFLAVVVLIFGYARRGLKSWWAGVTSGLVLLPFASAFLLSILPSSRVHQRFILGLAAAGTWFLVSFVLYLTAKIRAERTVREDEFTVPTIVKSLAGSELSESDDPIQSWPQDALGRAALVDSLSVKIMIAKAPVLALSGAFGVGKTSILNLLREHLGDKAITISFSTWLPGSQETLTSYLLADIASECKKRYIVPGLRQSARRLATALGQRVPVLGDYLKLLPSTTQKDDIENLKSALVRLPKRVVVLLDEIDRMENEEIITLLKVIRGIATLPNLSFVCAGSVETMVTIAKKDDEYFEKFFPVVISVPEPDPAALRRMGADRLVATFVSRDWFENSSQAEQFKKRIESVWDARIAPFCKTLRAVGLLANDVSVAAAPLRREVDPVDLTLIEMLHRFKPFVYKLVAKSSFALTGGESFVRGGPYHNEKDEEEARKKLFDDLKEAFPDNGELEQVHGVINELFPLVSKTERLSRRARRRSEQSTTVEENDKRVREPGIFPAYFRYELPDEIYSSVQLASLLQKLERASTQEACDALFLNSLQSMGKGSLKRDDFLRKLADAVKSIPLPVAKSLGQAAAKASANYTYDMMAQFAEAGHVLRMILVIAKRLSKTDRATFLQHCILEATDDTMAFRILTILPAQKDDDKIETSVAELYGSFATRMRKRYGREVDAVNFDLSTSDTWALEYWGRDLRASGIMTDPQDRKMQNDFWLRYIGHSRSRLAKAFREFFLPVAAYSTDPTPLVENRISIADLKKLYEELPEDATLTDGDRKSLTILSRFLDGEFKNGIEPTSGVWS